MKTIAAVVDDIYPLRARPTRASTATPAGQKRRSRSFAPRISTACWCRGASLPTRSAAIPMSEARSWWTATW